MESRQPRRIRDIAHLYLSGVERRSSAQKKTVAVAGVSVRLFPAFHAANLAAAFAASGWTVHVVEQSGLVVNAGRFLSLPAAVYVDGPYAADETVYAALDGVSLGFSRASTMPACADGNGARKLVELVHVPPFESANHAEVFGELVANDDLDAVVWVCSAGWDLPALPGAKDVRVGALTVEGVGQAHAQRTADQAARAGDSGARRREVLPHALPAGRGAPRIWGHAERWRQLLCDPLPVALRAPESALARAYRDVARHAMERERMHYGTGKTARPPARRRIRSYPARDVR